VDEHTVSAKTDNQGPNLQKRAEVSINVIDVDEPPVFSQTEYMFSIYEGPFKNPRIGAVSARDPDSIGYKIRYKVTCIFIHVSKKMKSFLCSAVLSKQMEIRPKMNLIIPLGTLLKTQTAL